MELGLAGKVALVTGSTRGIGLSIAEHLLDEGAHVAICARSEERVTATVARLSDRAEGRVIGRAVDVADADRLSSWITDAGDELGGIDVLVPCVSAGGGPDKWQQVYENDVMGTVRSVEAALPFLQASDAGAITIINTTAAVETFRGPSAYAAFKAALLNYAKNLSRELAPSGVRVNSVLPGPVFFEGGPWEVIKAAQPEYVASVEAEMPMGRWATPADVARAVTFLSSPAAEYISGTALVVDGGFLRRIQY
jgi:NAD(P)-dependent dehydrogenase (short-subunit alcohol dehydrogenase family)